MPPNEFSIRRLLTDIENKSYLGSMNSIGFEWGVGRGGSYAGHYHRVLSDVLFAPSGMNVRFNDGEIVSCKLLVVSPGVFYEPLVLTDFWFMKFLSKPRLHGETLPDKVLVPPPGRSIEHHWMAISNGSLAQPFVLWESKAVGSILFELHTGRTSSMSVMIDGQMEMSVSE